MRMLTKASFVTIYVGAQDRALAFYRDVLGFEVLTDVPMGEEMGEGAGSRWIEVGIKGAETHFVLYAAADMESRVGKLSDVVFDSDDIVATIDELKAKDVEVTQEPQQMPWGWWAQFKDSEGNEFGLGQSRSGPNG
jgi:predicted enzyme related to lactoylglutathione lyase